MASTHKGHCQACGRLQMLPKGNLALHGYTVSGGFFSGVCRGSKFLPFEESCDQVRRYIAEAKASLASLEAFITTLRQPVTEGNVAWFRSSLASPKGRYYGSVRGPWTEREITTETNEREYVRYFVDGDTAWKRDADGVYRVQPVRAEINTYYADTTVQKLATTANGHYASNLEMEAKSLRRYIAWQVERVATWKPAPLLPVSSKDKQGFDPEAK